MSNLMKLVFGTSSLSRIGTAASSTWSPKQISSCFFATLHPRNTGRPKQPMNAFFLYLKEERQATAQSDPRQFVKGAAQRWRELSEVDKKPFLKKQKQLQDAYRAELNSFNAILSKEEKRAYLEDFRHNKQKRQKRIHKKQVLQTDPPKRSRSAMAFYVSSRFSAVKVGSIQDGSELLRESLKSWKDMFALQKQPFIDQAVQDKSRYDHEMQEYVQRMKAEGKSSLLPVKYQKQIAAQEKRERKMKKG